MLLVGCASKRSSWFLNQPELELDRVTATRRETVCHPSVLGSGYQPGSCLVFPSANLETQVPLLLKTGMMILETDLNPISRCCTISQQDCDRHKWASWTSD